MQAISVYLYPNKLDVFTNLPSAWSTERYRKVYNRNIKIFRGVDNRVDLQVRNPDEKKQDITGSTLVFHLVSRETQELLIQKDCIISSIVNGQAYVILTEEEVNLLEPGFYQYAVTKELRTPIDSTTHTVTSRTPLYGISFKSSMYGWRTSSTTRVLTVLRFFWMSLISVSLRGFIFETMSAATQ